MGFICAFTQLALVIFLGNKFGHENFYLEFIACVVVFTFLAVVAFLK